MALSRERRMTMSSNLIISQLKSLRLPGMAEAVSDMLKLPVQMRPSLESAVTKMIETEIRSRDDNRTARLLKAARLPEKVLIESITCSAARNLTFDQLSALSDCGFVRNGENLLITGKTGCGKSWLACAFGHQACTLGLHTQYMSMNHFTNILKQAKLDGTFEALLTQLNRIDLLIFDDFGLQEMDSITRIALLTLLDDRYGKKSVIITSQLALDKWYDYIAEATLADAIMDRLVNSSHHFDLQGPSLRTKRKK